MNNNSPSYIVKSILQQPNKECAAQALDKVNLTVRERDVLRFIYFDGLTAEQTAEAMDVSVSAVCKWKRAAVRKCAVVFSENL